MEFVDYAEAIAVLREMGVSEVRRDNGCVSLELPDDDEAIHLDLVAPGVPSDGRAHARTIGVGRDQIPDVVEHVLHKLHLQQVLIVPVAPWRNVFDAVAFSLASNEEWQEIDATVSVELNTRDPLLCTPADFNTLKALLLAVLENGSEPVHTLVLTTTTTPVMMELDARGMLHFSVGNQVLADEIEQMFGSPTG
ncbi:MAG: hypothetical protein KDA25_10170 [Phycisphaerales bacterium]|nr:hypothetical protein [Phycisphaerales bacterium]